jgi:hypothetical protein
VLLSGAYASVDWDDGEVWSLLPLGLLAVGGYLWGRWKALLWLGTVPWVALALLPPGPDRAGRARRGGAQGA